MKKRKEMNDNDEGKQEEHEKQISVLLSVVSIEQFRSYAVGFRLSTRTER